ncbi:leucine-rich repeat-containing protein 73-like [Mixophyes fleayi]|uniref:leucine-rich repeat-containing protein 73-like n=1 Tax=Mixophyes fleayi TaxID=3061075 RepID=UPI003F4D7DB3
MALGEGSRRSDVELSDSSDSSGTHASTANHRAAAFSNDVRSLPVPEQQVAAERQIQDGEEIADACSHISGAEVAGEDDLVCQISDLTTVLRECDEVDQLVLRNTGMTDSLLRRLAPAIAGSKSEVESINLNLNDISPDGAETIIHLLRKKPSIKSVLLYGNQLGDEGITTLTRGLSELWRIDSISRFQLSELDIGGNQLGREGLRSVASFLQLNPPLRHLGLAHSAVLTWDSWQELFDAIKTNTNLTHLLLDENSLGDAGARLVAEVIQVNRRLLAIDLDSNEIGEEGGRAIMETLASNTGSALTNISLDNNSISTGTREIIAKLLSLNTNNGDLL